MVMHQIGRSQNIFTFFVVGVDINIFIKPLCMNPTLSNYKDSNSSLRITLKSGRIRSGESSSNI